MKRYNITAEKVEVQGSYGINSVGIISPLIEIVEADKWQSGFTRQRY